MYLSGRAEPIYEATAKVFIGPRTVQQGDIGETLGAITFSRDFVASYAQQLQSRPIAEQVVERFQLEVSPAELTTRVETSIVPETRIIAVTVKDEDPERAALIANGIIETFVDAIGAQGSTAGVQASVFESALPPSSPVSPKPLRDGVMAWLLGAMIGVGIAMGLEQLDTRLRSREEVEAAIAPTTVLAAVPASGKSGDDRRLWLESHPGSSAAESFRILRTNLQFLAVERSIRTVLVTSPSPQEGKTTVASNLAASMAAGGYRTLLVDGDMRHPTVQLYFGLEHTQGLSDVLAGTLDLSAAIRETSFHNLFVMTAGPQPPNPSELFGSQRMTALIEALEQDFDIVVFDAPPTLLVADAPALSSNLDGVIFVVRAGKTSRDQAREALRRYTLLDARILGAVLNGSRKLPSDRYYGYAYRDYYRGDVSSSLTRREGDLPVLPAQARPGRRDESGRSIESILADLETLSTRRRGKSEGGTNGASSNGGTSHAAADRSGAVPDVFPSNVESGLQESPGPEVGSGTQPS